MFSENGVGDLRYKRVSRTRPCLICGKSDWCSRATDDSISFCARVTAGADRLSRKENWGVFYHDRDLLNQSFGKTREPRNFRKRQTEEILPAPLEIRDFIYSALLRLSPANDFDILIDGTKGLAERGLENFADYGGLPCSVFERKYIAAQARRLLNQNFPAFVRENPHGLRHVPGFWIDESGEANLWQNRDYLQPLLLIPYRNPAGKIQACQIRFTGVLKADSKRYLWLSLPKKNSASSGTPLHYANWKNFGQAVTFDKPILVTEGALKADAAAKLCPDYFVIANGGVSCAQELIVNISRGKTLYLAFDNDYHENSAVVRQLAKLLKLRLDDNQTKKAEISTKILTWTRTEKGIDDALLKGEKLGKISLLEWFSALDNQSRIEVQKTWEMEN